VLLPLPAGASDIMIFVKSDITEPTNNFCPKFKGFIEINIYIKALYGFNLIELSKQLQLEIKQTLKNMLDLDHIKVDVHIEGIVKEKEPVLHGN